MHLIDPATTTRDYTAVATEWKTHDREWNSDACVPEAVFDKDKGQLPTLLLGDHPVPLDEYGIARLCAFYGVPAPFFNRLTPAEQHVILNGRIQRTGGEVVIAYDDKGITDVRKPTRPRLAPEEFIRAARRVMPTADVVAAWITPADLRLDILSTTPLADGVRGGLRFTQNRRSNLAPTVSPLLHHQDSTSYVEITDPSLRIDARGLSIDRIADQLAAEALRADARLPSDAEHLLALAQTPIGMDRMTRLHRAAEDYGLPVRPLAAITVALSRETEPTMLSLALAIANTANTPQLQTPAKRTVARKLQAVAGYLVTDEAARCGTCAATLPGA